MAAILSRLQCVKWNDRQTAILNNHVQSTKTFSKILHIYTNFQQIMSNCISSVVPAYGLALSVARISAATMITMFWYPVISFIGLVLKQGSHGSLFPGKVLTFEYGSLGAWVLSFNHFYKKVLEKSIFFFRLMNECLIVRYDSVGLGIGQFDRYDMCIDTFWSIFNISYDPFHVNVLIEWNWIYGS